MTYRVKQGIRLANRRVLPGGAVIGDDDPDIKFLKANDLVELVDDYVERATANPGEKRAVKKPAKKTAAKKTTKKDA